MFLAAAVITEQAQGAVGPIGALLALFVILGVSGAIVRAVVNSVSGPSDAD